MLGKAIQPITINGIEFDALIEEENTYNADIPEYAVDAGYKVSDNISVSAEVLKIKIVASDTPVTWRTRHGINTATSREQRLRELFFSKAVCTISTSRRTYVHMAMESISFPRSLDSGTSPEISISFKGIRTTSVAITTYPGTYGKAGATMASAGAANVTKSSEETSSSKTGNSTIIWSIYSGFFK